MGSWIQTAIIGAIIFVLVGLCLAIVLFIAAIMIALPLLGGIGYGMAMALLYDIISLVVDIPQPSPEFFYPAGIIATLGVAAAPFVVLVRKHHLEFPEKVLLWLLSLAGSTVVSVQVLLGVVVVALIVQKIWF